VLTSSLRKQESSRRDAGWTPTVAWVTELVASAGYSYLKLTHHFQFFVFAWVV